MITTRKCATCKFEKQLEEFRRDKTKKYGREYTCRLCERKRWLNQTEEQLEKRRISDKKYRLNNKDKLAARRRNYVQKNREKIYARNKKWRETSGYKHISEYNPKYYKDHQTEIDNKHREYMNSRDEGLYKRFMGAKGRCVYPSHSRYSFYGGRGIKFLWDSYEEFKNDMEDSFKEHVNKFGLKNTTIDRINVNGNYEKANCRWATWDTQLRNRRGWSKQNQDSV